MWHPPWSSMSQYDRPLFRRCSDLADQHMPKLLQKVSSTLMLACVTEQK